LMERGSNVNIPNFCKRTLSHYAVCNNNTQRLELWVQLSTNLNHQEYRYMARFTIAVVMEGVFFVIYLLIFNIFVVC
jgi:hypothetical protein